MTEIADEDRRVAASWAPSPFSEAGCVGLCVRLAGGTAPARISEALRA